MGMEDPEAAAEEYREKVTQSENPAGNVVHAKAPGWFLPKGRKWTAGWQRREERVWFPAGGDRGPVGNPDWGQRGGLGDGKRKCWKFPI